MSGYAGCKFSFDYRAWNHQGLKYDHWIDQGTDGVTEVFIGDIATA